MIDSITNNNASAVTVQNAAPAPASQQSGAQYDFAEIFGAASDERGPVASSATDSSPTTPASSAGGLQTAIAQATTTVMDAAATTTAPASDATSTPGIETLVDAIMNGSFQGTNVTDPSQLQETTPIGTDTMPNFYYASDQTASQLAALLGGKVVQMKAFGQDQGWTEPNANFIELPNGQTFNAADVAYYSRAGVAGATQLTADITATINEGAAWTNWYQNGGQMPTFATGYVGPAITGMAYASGSVGADGNVINPAMQSTATQGT
jgi:hypothetical protein